MNNNSNQIIRLNFVPQKSLISNNCCTSRGGGVWNVYNVMIWVNQKQTHTWTDEGHFFSIRNCILLRIYPLWAPIFLFCLCISCHHFFSCIPWKHLLSLYNFKIFLLVSHEKFRLVFIYVRKLLSIYPWGYTSCLSIHGGISLSRIHFLINPLRPSVLLKGRYRLKFLF